MENKISLGDAVHLESNSPPDKVLQERRPYGEPGTFPDQLISFIFN
jgi:hypothetical protein